MIPALRALPPPSYRQVLVGGVEIELFESSKPSRSSPQKISLSYWADSGDYSAEEITRLHLAGVEMLPLYESDDLKWEEIG